MLNLTNKQSRTIKCIVATDKIFTQTEHLLEEGTEYTLVRLRVYDDYSVVYLEEIPHIPFNTVCFEEMEEKAWN